VSDSQARFNGITLDAQPPFTFGLGLQGELQIGFVLSGVSAFLVIPAEELGTLQRGLNDTQTIRDTLSAKPPPQGAH
jgi:hypothetical protein